jgi:cell wall-associated NlpC family hydrolase
MNKVPGWNASLNALIKERTNQPFVWGKTDCSMFISDATLIMTGQDPGKRFRGKYKTAIGSLKALKRHGSGDLKSTFLAAFGEPIARLQATKGDLCYFETDEGPTAGIIYGAGIVSPGVNGLVTTPITAGLLFWSIEQWQ